MSNVFQNVAGYLVALFHKVLGWVETIEEKLSPAIEVSENLLNAMKKFEASDAGQTIEAVIEKFIPASSGLIDAFKLALPNWLEDLGLGKAEIGKSLTDQWNDALVALSNVKDPDVYALYYNSLKALYIKFFGTNMPELDTLVNIQQAATLAQPTHNLALVVGE